jgi:hypothetical protein
VTTPEDTGTQPATKVGEARAALHAALRLAMADRGWPEERAHATPPGQPVSPAAWVDAPTLHQAPTEHASAVAVTFPLVFTVNGVDQVGQLDDVVAFAWQRAGDVRVGPYTVRPQTAGPENVDVGPATVRAIVLRVQVTVRTATLCQQSLVQSNDEGTS